MLRRRLPELVAALFGLAWFLWIGGGRVLPPSALDAFTGDTAQHVLGWLFFRREPWSWPLGRIAGLAWPVGTTLGFTDSNPLVALALRGLSPLLPVHFQFVGLWLAACFALQGWLGARLAALATPRPAFQALGGALFALSPALSSRVAHDTLCAHFAILLLLLLHLAPAPDRASARRSARAGWWTALLAAAVHPYLGVMLLALALALLARHALEGGLSRGEAAGRGAALVLAQAAVFWVLGYFGEPSHARDFGLYSADLLAFVNPYDASSLLPAIPTLPEQFEGRAYLGAGALALAAVSLGLAARARLAGPRLSGAPARRAPLAAVTVLFTLFALTYTVRLAGRPILDLSRPLRFIEPLAAPFRASGRFIWPVHYLLLAAAVITVARRLAHRPRTATGILALALALQLADLAPRARDVSFTTSGRRLRSPTWALARGHYDVLALWPPLVVGVWSRCRGMTYGDDQRWIPFALVAYDNGMALNSAQLARGSGEKINRGCDAQARLLQGPFPRRILYVVAPSELPALRARPDVVCGTVEGEAVCVAAANRDPLRGALVPPPP